MTVKNKHILFVIEFADGSKIRIKAAKMHHGYSGKRAYGFWREFHSSTREPDAIVNDNDVVSVVPQDMLLSTFEDNSVFPDIVDMSSEEVDLIEDALFSEEDKEPFSQAERRLIQQALAGAADKIRKEYSPDPSDLANIQQKIDYLSKKVTEIGKFDWKRLLVVTLVGISIDLGFGSVVPATLTALFTEIFGHFAKRIGKYDNNGTAESS